MTSNWIKISTSALKVGHGYHSVHKPNTVESSKFCSKPKKKAVQQGSHMELNKKSVCHKLTVIYGV